MISLENIFSHEMIGMTATISNSSNNEIIGLNGTIVDETKSMFTLKTVKKFKKIPKTHSTWKFNLTNQEITIDGVMLEKRSFDRLRSKI